MCAPARNETTGEGNKIMKIVLGGNFESALVRLHDEEVSPNRNKTPHSYYLDLNRNTDRIYRDGAATFAALAESVSIPWELDWNESNIAKECGIAKTPRMKEDLDWQVQYEIISKLIDGIMKDHVLSYRSLLEITSLDFRGYSDDVVSEYGNLSEKNKNEITKNYLRRLLHQVYAANSDGCYLVISEVELEILNEIAKFLTGGDFHYNIPFPDLSNKIIDPEELADGILTFSPKDVLSLRAVRDDSDIQKYAERVRKEIGKVSTSGLTQAAVEAYRKTEIRKRSEHTMEIVSWVVKPLHYIPGIDAALTIGEDVKDLALKAIRWKEKCEDWHIIGVKMQQIANDDFIRRVGNRFPKIDNS
jgi:hypothetical protein